MSHYMAEAILNGWVIFTVVFLNGKTKFLNSLLIY